VLFPPALDPEAAVSLLEQIPRKSLRQLGATIESPRVIADGSHGFERPAGLSIVKRIEDQPGQPIPNRHRQRHGPSRPLKACESFSVRLGR
jgi:hypothetical protein